MPKSAGDRLLNGIFNLLGVVLLGFVVIGFPLALVATYPFVGMVVVAALGIGYFMHRNELNADSAKAGAAVKALANHHIATLARKRSQLISTDDYGRINRDAWNSEVTKFVREIVKPSLNAGGQRALEKNFQEACVFVDELATLEQSKRINTIAYREDLDPKEFEAFCAAALTQIGWSARTVGQAGDQGADVLAEKGGRRVVIQCKKYSGTVGNFAVQEAHAAKAHYSA
jgi:restriction system protein